MRGTFVVPTLNEARSVGHVLDTFRDAAERGNRTIFASDPIDWEMIVVDGASTDATAEIARKAGARVIEEPRKGYGRAYKTGFAASVGDVIATADGDATYPVEEIPRLVRMLVDDGLDFITGNRLDTLEEKAMTREHRLGNWVLNFVVQFAYHRYLRSAQTELRDSQSGMWILRRSVLEKVHPVHDGMPFSEELKIDVLLEGMRFREVPIHYAERWGVPKLSTWRDGQRNLTFLLAKRLSMGPGAPAPRPQPHPKAEPRTD